MSKYNKETLNKLDKSKLVRLLEKEGIEASFRQSKAELIRLLTLATKANSPTMPVRLEKSTYKGKFLGVLLILLMVGLMVGLYYFNPTFRKNINFLVKKVVPSEEVVTVHDGPAIYEKNGKTFIVYDHPLISVKAVYDPACKRPECVLANFEKQVKSHITPLISFTPVDYNSREGRKLTENYNLNLLPVFLFDLNIEKTDNFENSKRNLEKIQDKYVLQVPPTNLLNGPKLSNARGYKKTSTDGTVVDLIEYAGFSCTICAESSAMSRKMLDIFDEKFNYYVKYFNSGERDLPASVAAECAGQQNRFPAFYDMLFEQQEDWIHKDVANLNNVFVGYAKELELEIEDFEACLSNENVKQIVLAHFNEAGSLGINAAPTLVLDNNVLVGVYSPEELTEIFKVILSQ